MQEAKAISKYVRISPRKARLVADLIRGKSVEAAQAELAFSPHKAGRLLKKTLDSAVANAEHNYDMQADDLAVVEVRVDEGPTMKRARPKCRGGRVPVMKRTSHLTVVVAAE
ncbi:MAG: 50S ribosomal protein L22 [Chlamydiia bacterium]|nr:50S ribosomal protein L22 [Chlamydiia bacterium]